MRFLIILLIYSLFISCSLIKLNVSPKRNISSVSKQLNCNELLRIFLDAQSGLTSKEKKKLIFIVKKMREISGENLPGVSQEQVLKMDKVFTEGLRERIRELNFSQLEQLENIMNRTIQSAFLNFRKGAHVTNLTKPEEMVLELNVLFSNHPFIRIIIWHELDHIIESILKNSLRVKRIETLAFSAQYEFTRKIYKLSELKELKRKFPTNISGNWKDRLVQSGILIIDGSNIDFDVTKLNEFHGDIKIVKDFNKFIERFFLNRMFIQMVEGALTMSKKDFLKKSLIPYRKKILIDGAVDAAVLGGISIAGLSGYFIYKLLMDDEE